MSDKTKILLTTFVPNKDVFLDEYALWSNLVDRYIDQDEVSIKVYKEEGLDLNISSAYHSESRNNLLDRSPHCNKILPLLDESNFDYDGIVITDTDLFVVDDVMAYFRNDRIRTAPNNGNNPPIEVYEKLFSEFDIKGAVRPGVSLMSKEGRSRESYINNNSGGIIMVPQKLIKPLGEAWYSWAKKLVAKMELLGPWSIHVDQVAFALAMESLGEDIDFLPPQVNTVLPLLPYVNHVKAFHIAKAHRREYHHWFDSNGYLKYPTTNAHLQNAMSRLNAAIEVTSINRDSDNKTRESSSLISKLFTKK